MAVKFGPIPLSHGKCQRCGGKHENGAERPPKSVVALCAMCAMAVTPRGTYDEMVAQYDALIAQYGWAAQ